MSEPHRAYYCNQTVATILFNGRCKSQKSLCKVDSGVIQSTMKKRLALTTTKSSLTPGRSKRARTERRMSKDTCSCGKEGVCDSLKNSIQAPIGRSVWARMSRPSPMLEKPRPESPDPSKLDNLTSPKAKEQTSSPFNNRSTTALQSNRSRKNILPLTLNMGAESLITCPLDKHHGTMLWTCRCIGEIPALERQGGVTITQKQTAFQFTPSPKTTKEELSGGTDTNPKKSSSSTISTGGYRSPTCSDYSIDTPCFSDPETDISTFHRKSFGSPATRVQMSGTRTSTPSDYELSEEDSQSSNIMARWSTLYKK